MGQSMKKELFISILIGFGLGLLIMFGIYTANRALKENGKIQSPIIEPDATQSGSLDLSMQTLTIVSPIDQTIIKEAKTVLSGVTSPGSWVVILAEKGEIAILADNEGSFETEIALIGGENEIEIISIAENGERASKTITVVYSTVEI